MGEIIYSICTGGFLVISGILMFVILSKEEKKHTKGKQDGEK